VVTADENASQGPGLHQMVKGDNALAQGLGAKIGDGKLSGLLGTLDSAIGKVSDFAKATQATINGVLDPIRDVAGRVETLIATTENTLNSVTTLGGLVPNNPLSRTVRRIEDQVNATTRSADLFDLQSTVGRLAGNLGAAKSGGAEVVVAGGDLYRLAETAYGDAREWATIAKANGLADPVISGVQKLLVPPKAAGVDGVLGA
jgi:nucleoid-associated protein YgaU